MHQLENLFHASKNAEAIKSQGAGKTQKSRSESENKKPSLVQETNDDNTATITDVELSWEKSYHSDDLLNQLFELLNLLLSYGVLGLIENYSSVKIMTRTSVSLLEMSLSHPQLSRLVQQSRLLSQNSKNSGPLADKKRQKGV